MKGLMLLPILVAGLVAAEAGPAQERRQGEHMMPAEVVAHVKQKDWRIVERPGIVGADAGPALLPLLDDPDAEVRQLTVTCLNEAGGDAARRGLLKAIRDKVETVAGLAARFLRKRYAPEDLPTIEAELDRSRDDYVREQLGLLLGETGDPAKIPLLQGRLARERDENARHAASLALARLGDGAARQQQIDRLLQPDAKRRVDALKDLPYVNDRGLLKQALPLLDDTREAVRMGRSHGPKYALRVCDVAINVANEMLGNPFPWVQPIKRYAPQEIDQAKAALAALP
jgi:hypothetical protein